MYPEGHMGHCYPMWLADYQKHAFVARLIEKRCSRCEIPLEYMSHDVNM
jgi:hypothetical protein